jgi:hypothetical protein
MKHVFYIHSQTCYITSLKVIQYSKILKEDVIFLISRNTPLYQNHYKSYHIYPIIDNWPFYTHKTLINFKWIYNRRIKTIVDKIIENFIGEDFIFYSQNSRHYKYNLFISSYKCVDNRFIEDGLDMYTSYQEFNIKYPKPLRLRYLLGNSILGFLQNLRDRVFQKNNPFWSKTGVSLIYTLSPLSCSQFSVEMGLKTLDLGKIPTKLTFKNLSNTKPIIVPSALEEQMIVSNTIMCNSYLHYLKNNSIKEVYIKWHPSHTLNSKNYILKRFCKANIAVDIIPDAIPLEALFSSERAFEVITHGSSLAIYAAVLGTSSSKVLYPILHKLNGKLTPRSQYWINTFPKLNFERLTIIPFSNE